MNKEFMSDNIQITKASGERTIFNSLKLRGSLERSGAGPELVEHITSKINEFLIDGMSTKEIYKMAFSLLRKNSRPTAARYKLKKAIMELGPTGYPFERFVGEILKFQEFDTQVGVMVQGHCVRHEVDVVAEKDQKHYMIECKFHGDQGRHCDVKIPLYIQSRFLDVAKQWRKKPGHKTKFHQGWIVTNTRFTKDAIQFGNCVGLMLVSWDHPKKGSLKERIEVAGLHPITCLTTLSKKEKQQLLSKDKVLCKELCMEPNLLDHIGVPVNRHKKILREANEVCEV